MARVVEVIVTEQPNVPDAETVAPQLVIVAPDPIVVEIVAPTENPEPETVTEAPLGPWVGESEMLGWVTVNEAVALSKLPSEPVAVTV